MKMLLTKQERAFLSECSKRGHASMTPEARKERARKAANARWGKTDGSDGTEADNQIGPRDPKDETNQIG